VHQRRYAGNVLEGQLAPGMQVIGKPFALDTLAAQVEAILKTAPAARDSPSSCPGSSPAHQKRKLA